MKKNNINNSKQKVKKAISIKLPKHLDHINQMAAGIDIGSASHFVAVPEGCATESVREFKSFTADLYELAAWLKECKVTTVAMESTGVYWIPLYELLEQKGFDVKLVDARHVKNVSGRKTDVMDCQWLQQLHTYGLLQGAFRPDEQICELRAYLRQRSMLIQHMAQNIQHMQKSLSQMNIQLHNVITDITGETGMNIIRAIVAGERDSSILADYRRSNCKNSLEIIKKSLEGNYRNEHIFTLKQALELYDIYQDKIKACDIEIEKKLLGFENKSQQDKKNNKPEAKKHRSYTKNKLSFDASSHLTRITGVDLTEIPGIEASTALKVISEIGLDLTRWKSSKQFASWLGLCPGNKISGGKTLSSKTKRTGNYASSILRMAASTLHRSNTALGAFFRRMKSRLGTPKAITAVAHKLAVIIYNMLKNGTEYIESGQDYYEEQYKDRILQNLRNKAKSLGFELVSVQNVELALL
jgi:transposase